MKKQITKGIIFKYLKNSLREIGIGNHNELICTALKKMVDAGLVEKPRTTNLIEYYNHICARDKEIEALIVECYTYLLTHGIIIPKPETPQYGNTQAWSSFRITEYGRAWANSEEEPIPEDIQGVIYYLKSAIPSLDNIITQYINEALNAFNGGLHFASAVMIGAASEKLIYLLSEATKKAAKKKPSVQKKFQDALEHRRLFALLNLLNETLNPLVKKNTIPYTVHEGSLQYLTSLFDAIRVQRNDAVHPIAGRLRPDQLRLTLLCFPHVCKKTYGFLAWLNNNQF